MYSLDIVHIIFLPYLFNYFYLYYELIKNMVFKKFFIIVFSVFMVIF